MGVLCALTENPRTMNCGIRAAHIPLHRSMNGGKIMKQSTAKKTTDNNNQIPVYLTVHYGKKGSKMIYTHSEQIFKREGYQWLSSWRSLAGPIRYRAA